MYFYQYLSIDPKKYLSIDPKRSLPRPTAQRKFVSPVRHAQSNAHKPAKTVAPTVLIQNCGSYSLDDRIKVLTEVYCSDQYQSIHPKKSFPRPNAHKLQKNVN